jgi:iron complex transport system ATP-binding protein
MLNIEIKGMTLSYNHHPVVSELTFALCPGELVGLVGPNGCGKTSVIKALSRILPLRSGQVLIGGQDLRAIPRPELAKLVGVVPQNPYLPETFSVLDVVMLGRNPHLGLLSSESSHDLAVVWWAMEQTEITHLARRRLGELSGGEKQRVTIARVLAQEPQAILLDEPTANLDLSHQIEILELVKDLCENKQICGLIAIHDINMAAQYCDRLIMLKAGRLYAEGPPGQVITADNIKEVFGASSTVYPHPENQLPVVLLSVSRRGSTAPLSGK